MIVYPQRKPWQAGPIPMQQLKVGITGWRPGGRVHGPTYALQRGLLSRGQTYAAFMADVVDACRVATLQGDTTKYDSVIAQATAYAEWLKRNGIMR